MIPTEPTDLPESPAWLKIEHGIAELPDGGPAPTDPEDVRMPEYKFLLQVLHEMEYHAGVEYRKKTRPKH